MLNTTLLLNEVSEKRREYETKFPKTPPQYLPEMANAAARVSLLSHKRFFILGGGGNSFFSRAELFRICDGFAHSAAFLTSKCFTPFGLEREMPFETVVVQHTPILILPTSQTITMDRDLLFTRILFILQI